MLSTNEGLFNFVVINARHARYKVSRLTPFAVFELEFTYYERYKHKYQNEKEIFEKQEKGR